MSYTRGNIESILEIITNEFNLDMNEIKDKIKDIYVPATMFASISAKEKAKELKLDINKIVPSSKNGKITLEDVKKAAGIKVEKKESISPFVSQRAYELAVENNLSEKDFPVSERSGKDRKTKKKDKITVEDVRKKIVISSNSFSFASKEAKKMAEQFNVDVSKITGTGKDNKIRKVDIEDFLQEKNKSEEEDENDEENSEDEDENDEEEENSEEENLEDENDEENSEEENLEEEDENENENSEEENSE